MGGTQYCHLKKNITLHRKILRKSLCARGETKGTVKIKKKVRATSTETGSFSFDETENQTNVPFQTSAGLTEEGRRSNEGGKKEEKLSPGRDQEG